MMFDLHNNVMPVRAIPPATLNQAGSPEYLVGTDIDLLGYLSAEVVVDYGAIDEIGTSPVGSAAINIKLEHSDDGITYTAVVLAEVLGPASVTGGIVATVTTDTALSRIGYIGGKRYLQVTLQPVGLTNGGPVGAWVIKGNPRHGPAS